MPRGLNFEDALYNLKLGKTVARQIWNDVQPRIHILMVPEAATQIPHKYGGGYHVAGSFWVKTAEDALIPYAVSHADLLADDWIVLENPERADQKKIAHA
jgi:Protein of unknown function (DUF2829)